MTDQLHQMNIAYVPKEDRLLLRVSSRSGDEYRVWLTRRFTGILIDVLNKEIDKSGGVPTIASSQETKKMVKEGALEKSYDNDSANYPLGESGVLAFRLNAGKAQDGSLKLELSPEKGKGITINLNKALLYMFYNILTQGIDQSGWRLINNDISSMKIH